MDFIYILTFFIALFYLTTFLYKKKNSLPLPPGPPRLPLLGNAHQMLDEAGLLDACDAWRKKYGNILYLSIMGKPMIVLNSLKSAIDLLDKRGAIYSDRPYYTMLGELVGYKHAIISHTYDQSLRESRKHLVSRLASNKISERHQVIEDLVVRYLLSPLLSAPEHFEDHIRKVISGELLFAAYGYTVAAWPERDPLADLSQQCLDEFQAAMKPGAWLVDTFPIMRYIPEWFPGATFKKCAREWHATSIRVKDEPWNRVKEDMKKGTASPSITSSMLESNPNMSVQDEELCKWVSVGIYTAGSEAQRNIMRSFFLMMVVYPHIQKKAQEELDRVVGSDRLPSMGDRKSLPYINAILKETLRLNPILPLGFPHRLMRDDEYEGYLIPEDSAVMVNIWEMGRDPTYYPSPLEFSPERYLDRKEEKYADKQEISINPDPEIFAFGFGRRICPGMAMGDAILFATVTMVLSQFTITPVLNDEGKPEKVEARYTKRIVNQPLPFRCQIVPRSANSISLIKDAFSKFQ